MNLKWPLQTKMADSLCILALASATEDAVPQSVKNVLKIWVQIFGTQLVSLKLKITDDIASDGDFRGRICHH